MENFLFCYCVQEAIHTHPFQERSAFACTIHTGVQGTWCASFDGPPLAGGCRESNALETGGGRADLLAFLRRTLEGTQGRGSSKHTGFPTLCRSELLCLQGLISTFLYLDRAKSQRSPCESAHSLPSSFPMDMKHLLHTALHREYRGMQATCPVQAHKSSRLPLEEAAIFQSLRVGRCERRKRICLKKLRHIFGHQKSGASCSVKSPCFLS